MKIGSIEKSIPFPSHYRENILPSLRKMEVGESFFVEAESGEVVRIMQGRIASSMVYIHKEKEKRFTSKTYDTGIRVWRIS